MAVDLVVGLRARPENMGSRGYGCALHGQSDALEKWSFQKLDRDP